MTAYPVRRVEESMFWRQDAKCTNASSFRQKTRCFACDPPIKTSFARCFNRCSDSSSRQEKILSILGRRVFSFRNDKVIGSKISASRMFGWCVDIFYEENFGDKR
ncbi:MAG: hypothetical protein DWH78_01540 [Planctomycetota bacterium]|nr:MAG: hypothetical protein DWH78_01540 [Planctomycetota bacterium]